MSRSMTLLQRSGFRGRNNFSESVWPAAGGNCGSRCLTGWRSFAKLRRLQDLDLQPEALELVRAVDGEGMGSHNPACAD